MTTSLNPQQMSPFTRGLFDRQQRFQKEAGNDSSLAGKVKANLVGRVVVRFGMALILHAEAVSRAVYACFLMIRHCFSGAYASLIQRQKVESSMAMQMSLRSFFSIFYSKLLDGISLESPPPPQPVVVSPPVIPPIVSVPPVPVDATPPQVSQPQQPEVVVVIQQPIEIQAHPSEQIAAAPVINNEQPIQSIDQQMINPAHLVANLPGQNSPPREVSGNVNHVDGDEQLELEHDEDIGSLDSHSYIGSNASYVHVGGISGSASRPQTPGRPRPIRTIQDRKEQKPELTADEQASLDEEWRLDQDKLEAFAEENKPLNILDVERQLAQEMRRAGRNVHHPYTQLKLETGFGYHFKDPEWTILPNNTSGMAVGICQYAENPGELKAQHLITQFELNIAGTIYPVRLLGLFDPLIGSRASDYLSQNLTAELTKKLKAFNMSKLSDDGIYNAIKSTFVVLNREFIEAYKDIRVDVKLRNFIADQGSTATVIMIIDGKLWTAQLGSSRAVLTNGEDPVQLNADQIPQFYEDKINKLGRTVKDGKLEMDTVFGRNDLHGAASSRPGILRFSLHQFPENSHLILGTSGIFEIVSSELVVNWVFKSKENLEHIARNIVYTIFDERQRQLKNNSLTCLIAKINATTPQNEPENKSNVNDHSSNTSLVLVNIDSKEPSDVSFVNQVHGLTSLTDAIVNESNVNNIPLD